MEYWNLYTQQNGQLDVIPHGPRYGVLTITDTVNEEVLPEPLRKCNIIFYNEEAIAHWGEERSFWVSVSGDTREAALTHLNGQL